MVFVNSSRTFGFHPLFLRSLAHFPGYLVLCFSSSAMGKEDLPGAVGPLISPNYIPENIDGADVAASSVVWSLSLVWCGICSWQSLAQTKQARNPYRSVYIWMIWLEQLVCFAMGLECWCFIMKWIYPSFAFYFTILFWWCIQVQLLLQIIINRVRLISVNKRRAMWILIATAVVVTLINISVFNIWIPARLQISERYVYINEIWDRIEKGLYLIIDASLNTYFIRTVRKNLVRNGLQKYNSLLTFNTRIIFISILMDIMIIAAMSIPNSFIYIQFHPLAYLVKLNIELTMATLIRKIAMSTAAKRGDSGARKEYLFNHESRDTHTAVELSNSSYCHADTRLKFDGYGIRKTQEYVVRSMPHPATEQQYDAELISNSSTKDEQGSRISPDDMDDQSQLVRHTERFEQEQNRTMRPTVFGSEG
ncbi:hypothetical protein B0J12DRAFT_689812 [Macrophomina phaseolina]|uniref:Integral membrane protein n=1 Tax=Macrophomina phaseolina TaxID=35725 RepID=A0ABQ8FQY9_9PEZI|nr:hypothetical protein B0J12DRAFT_689812 [Macrophomina phaseolina]